MMYVWLIMNEYSMLVSVVLLNLPSILRFPRPSSCRDRRGCSAAKGQLATCAYLHKWVKTLRCSKIQSLQSFTIRIVIFIASHYKKHGKNTSSHHHITSCRVSLRLQLPSYDSVEELSKKLREAMENVRALSISDTDTDTDIMDGFPLDGFPLDGWHGWMVFPWICCDFLRGSWNVWVITHRGVPALAVSFPDLDATSVSNTMCYSTSIWKKKKQKHECHYCRWLMECYWFRFLVRICEVLVQALSFVSVSSTSQDCTGAKVRQETWAVHAGIMTTRSHKLFPEGSSGNFSIFENLAQKISEHWISSLCRNV